MPASVVSLYIGGYVGIGEALPTAQGERCMRLNSVGTMTFADLSQGESYRLVRAIMAFWGVEVVRCPKTAGRLLSEIGRIGTIDSNAVNWLPRRDAWLAATAPKETKT